MDQFEELRKAAVQRRDSLMAAAREEYTTTLAGIDRLARLLGGTKPKAPYRTLRQSVIDVLPSDRCFTLGQLFELLEASDPDRIFPLGSVRAVLHALEKDDVTKRVGRADGNTLWAVKGFEAADPFGAQTVRQVVGALLRELGPLTLEEMVIHLQGRGYRPGIDPRVIHENLRSGLKRCGNEFTRDSRRRWSIRAST